MRGQEKGLRCFNKKGNILIDIILGIVILFALVFFIFISQKVQVDVNNMIQNDTDIANVSKQISADNTVSYPSIWDGAYVVFFVIFWLMLIISSFLIDAHPIFFGIIVFAVIIILIIPAFLSNTYEEFSDDSDFVNIADSFPKIDWIMNHYVETWIVIIFSVLITLFAKSRL